MKRINADKAVKRAEAKLAKMSNVGKLALLKAMDIYVHDHLGYELVHSDLIEVWTEFEQQLGIDAEFVDQRDGSQTMYWLIDDDLI